VKYLLSGTLFKEKKGGRKRGMELPSARSVPELEEKRGKRGTKGQR